MLRALILTATFAVVAIAWGQWRSGDDVASISLPSQTVDAGGVEVTVTPLRLDHDEARFEVSLSTHTVELALDPADGAGLDVGSVGWGPARWEGDPPGGHHRGGRLIFVPRGPAGGTVQLSIDGLPEPVSFGWELEGP